MRKVIYQEYVSVPIDPPSAIKMRKLEDKGEALFHQFGVNYSEYGPGNFTTAVIELSDGTVKNLPVEQVRFVDPAEEERG